MGFFNRFAWVFASPTRLFDDIKEGRASWWQAWFWLSIIYLVVGYFSMPINFALIEINSQDLSPAQLYQQLAFFEEALLLLWAGLWRSHHLERHRASIGFDRGAEHDPGRPAADLLQHVET